MSSTLPSIPPNNVNCQAADNGPFYGHVYSSTNSTRHLAIKPRPANINTSASGCDQISAEDGNRHGLAIALSSSVPTMHHNMHFPNTPTSPSHLWAGNHMSPPQSAPIKKQSTIRNFFVCRSSQCGVSNSVAPFPKSPTSPTCSSPLAHFCYTPSQFAPPQNATHNPYPPHRSTLPPSSYGYAHRPSSSNFRHSNDGDYDHHGKTSSFPDSMISLNQISCDRDPLQLPSPRSPPEHARPPLSHNVPMRLGPHNLIIPPYEQLQKKREDLKRKDTSHMPQQNADGQPYVPSFHSKIGPTAEGNSQRVGQNNSGNNINHGQGEKTTVSAKYLTNHALNPEFARKYVVGDELGSGGFGFVVSAKRISDGREVAVKFIHKDKVPVHGWIHDAQMGYIPMEIYVIKNFPHPGIIAYLGMYDDFKFFYLVMELHGTPWTASNPVLQQPATAQPASIAPLYISSSGVASSTNGGLVGAAAAANRSDPAVTLEGAAIAHPTPKEKFKNPPRPGIARRTSCDLFECIEHHSKFSENKARHIFKQIADCVKFLNEYGICHRDIKDENIVIDKDLKVKLIDFGSAVIVRPTGRLFDRFYGTINYASPEILRGEKYRAESAEVWSLGILLYTLLYGEVPFNDPQQAIYRPYVTPKVKSSHECIHLLNWMLEKNGEQRATIEEVYNHPWLQVATDGKP